MAAICHRGHRYVFFFFNLNFECVFFFSSGCIGTTKSVFAFKKKCVKNVCENTQFNNNGIGMFLIKVILY